MKEEGREKKNEEKKDRISSFSSFSFQFPTSVSVTVTISGYALDCISSQE